MLNLLEYTITDLRSAKAVIKALGLKADPYSSLRVSRSVYDQLHAGAIRTWDKWQSNRSYTYGRMGLFIDGIHILTERKPHT